MSKLRIGIVGAGGIASAHLPHLQKRGDAVLLVGVADPNSEAAANMAAQYDMAHQVADFRELLPHVDAVLVCVPTHLHAQISAESLRAGKAVFCEKPLARTSAQADEIKAAQLESGAPLQVGFVRRFDEEWLSWRRAIEANKIGRPVVWRDVQAGSGPGIPWFNRDEQGGGPFLDGCIHNIDFALWTFGPAKWAFCHGRALNPSNTAIDTGSATVRFHSGDELMLAWSWGLLKGSGGGGAVFELLGPKGSLTWPRAAEDFRASPRFVAALGSEKDDEIVSYSAGSLQTAFADQMDEFIEVAQRRKTPRAGWNEGDASMRVGLAIIKSARTEQVVAL